MSLDIYQAFSRKSFFITGGSGFMGKVLLFKLLKEFPDFEVIYVLIRGKHSRKFKCYLGPQERLEKEVFGSPCFDPLRTSMGEENFKSLISRVVGVEGNITSDRLALKDKDCQAILQSVNFIIHTAATVNFDEKLNVAVETNTLGALRVLAIAKQCKNLESMVHISTCYVNYNLKGCNVEECLYPLPFDPESMCKHILALHENEITSVGPKLLQKYGFPNTYTFTKSMGEQLINSCKGNCPVSIIRPSIVGCSYQEPFPGWVDALTAAGGLLLTSGLGVVQEILGCPDYIADVVPVDFVVNTIIKALFKTQYYYKIHQRSENIVLREEKQKLQQGENKIGETILNSFTTSESLKNNNNNNNTNTNIGLNSVKNMNTLTNIKLNNFQKNHHDSNSIISNNNNNNNNNNTNSISSSSCFTRSEILENGFPFIYHAATSSSVNNLTWRRLRDATKYYWDWKKKHPKAIAPMKIDLIKSNPHYLLRFYIYRELPYYMFNIIANLPSPIGSNEKQELVKKLGKAIFRAKDLNRQFKAFTMNEWIFSTTNTLSLDDGLNEHSKSSFYFDTYMINWWYYAQVYSHGMLKYILKDTGKYESPAIPPTPTDIFKRASSL